MWWRYTSYKHYVKLCSRSSWSLPWLLWGGRRHGETLKCIVFVRSLFIHKNKGCCCLCLTCSLGTEGLVTSLSWAWWWHRTQKRPWSSLKAFLLRLVPLLQDIARFCQDKEPTTYKDKAVCKRDVRFFCCIVTAFEAAAVEAQRCGAIFCFASQRVVSIWLIILRHSKSPMAYSDELSWRCPVDSCCLACYLKALLQHIQGFYDQ